MPPVPLPAGQSPPPVTQIQSAARDVVSFQIPAVTHSFVVSSSSVVDVHVSVVVDIVVRHHRHRRFWVLFGGGY
jgi:hypothetical protein